MMDGQTKNHDDTPQEKEGHKIKKHYSPMLVSFVWTFVIPISLLWATTYYNYNELIMEHVLMVSTVDLLSSNKIDSSPLSVQFPIIPPQQPLEQTPPKTSLPKKKNERKEESSSSIPMPEGDRHQSLLKEIDLARKEYQSSKYDVYVVLTLADLLRRKEMEIHDGGSTSRECIDMYEEALDLLQQKSTSLSISEEDENELNSIGGGLFGNENDYVFMPLSAKKSKRALLLHAWTNMGKQFFLMNIFERAVDALTQGLKIVPNYIDALAYRASTYIILGKYDLAGADYATVLELDTPRSVMDSFTGSAKVLSLRPDAIPGSWNTLTTILDQLIPATEESYNSSHQNQFRQKNLAGNLKSMHLAMFNYHEQSTHDTEKAWYHLEKATKYKMSTLPPFPFALEQQRSESLLQIFTQNFWPDGVGHASKVPIFIIGFPRSGSTLLERILDAHPEIVGTGEDSVMNGRLPQIRNSVVQASISGSQESIQSTIQQEGRTTLKLIKQRYKHIQQYERQYNVNSSDENDPQISPKKPALQPRRFVDKMLTNYMNVGFIHLLFPNALILHIAREPMDTLFSTYKLDFPPGGLEYTSDFHSLAHMYKTYRTVMEHWDNVLPGRVTHVRYEDLVHDTPNIARAIIAQTGLSWHDDILDFHKKKHAVNTLSTTQVRKGIYKDSIQSWRKYEKYLRPLKNLVGAKFTEHTTQTTLKFYNPPPK